MAAERLLRLYPRAWRERYGEEFLATVGPEALSLQRVIDIVSGAIDAWLSADVRRATKARPVTPSGGRPMTPKPMMICESTKARYTTRDGLIGAGVMIAATLLFLIVGIAARREGWQATGEVLKALAFPASMTLSMPFWLMKGQPWKAQVVIVGGTLVMLVAIGYVSTLI